jgi:ferric-dicitrate binding protein FerR (iron transport regulator)
MGPERPGDLEGDEGRMPLGALSLALPRKQAIGDQLEALARGRQRQRRRTRVGLGVGAVLAAAMLALFVGRVRPDRGGPGGATHLRTGPADFQLLPLGERGVAFVSEQSEVELRPGSPPALRVLRGSVRLVVKRHQGEPFVVTTEAAEVAVLGTEFDVSVVDHATEVRVVRGLVEVRNAQGRRRLWPRESARARPGEAPRMVVPINSVVVDGPAEFPTPRAR